MQPHEFTVLALHVSLSGHELLSRALQVLLQVLNLVFSHMSIVLCLSELLVLVLNVCIGLTELISDTFVLSLQVFNALFGHTLLR